MSDSATYVEAECAECRWTFHRSQADELAGLGAGKMDDIIAEQSNEHERVTGHEVTTNEP